MTSLRLFLRFALALLVAAGAIAASVACAPVPAGSSARQIVPAADLAGVMSEKVFRDYIAAMNEIDLKNVDSFAPLTSIGSETLFQREINTLMLLYEQGYDIQGEIEIDSFEVQTVRGQRVQAIGCTDVSNYVVRDGLGTQTNYGQPEKVESHLEFVLVNGRVYLDRVASRPAAECDSAAG